MTCQRCEHLEADNRYLRRKLETKGRAFSRDTVTRHVMRAKDAVLQIERECDCLRDENEKLNKTVDLMTRLLQEQTAVLNSLTKAGPPREYATC